MSLSLFASALQLLPVTVHRSLHSLEYSVTVRAHLVDVSATGSPMGVSATLTDIGSLAAESSLERNTRKRALAGLAFGLRPLVHLLPSYLCVVPKKLVLKRYPSA